MADYDKIVKTVTETVLNQVNTELNSLRSRISHLENKLEQEANKRQALEEEVRRLKDPNNQSNTNSNNTSNNSSNPQVILPKKPSTFLRGSHTDLPDKRALLDNPNTNHLSETGTRNSRTQSDVGVIPIVNGVHHTNGNTANNTNNKQSTTQADDTSRQMKRSSDEGKSGWVKAPLPRDTDTKTDTFDTVLFDTASDRTVREGSLEKIGKTRQSWKVRWFRLQQGNLFYYKTSKDKKPIGDIPLQNCSVFRSKNAKKPFEFTISEPSRDWLFVARDEEEAEQWVEAIKSCSAKGAVHYT